MKTAYLSLLCTLICFPAQSMRILQTRPVHASAMIRMRHMHLNTAYQLMNATPYESFEVIQRKYRILAKLYHPDHNPQFYNAANKKYQEIYEAMETIRKGHRDPAAPFIEDSELAQLADDLRKKAYEDWKKEQENRERDADYDKWRAQETKRLEEKYRRYKRLLAGTGATAVASSLGWLFYSSLPVTSQEAIKKMHRDDLEQELQSKLGNQFENLQPVYPIKMKEFEQRIAVIEKSLKNCPVQEMLILQKELDAINKEQIEFLKHSEDLTLKAKQERDANKLIELLNQGANPNKIFLYAVDKNNHALVEALICLGAKENLNKKALLYADTPLMAFQLLKHGVEIENPEELFMKCMQPAYDPALIPFYATFLKTQKRSILFKEFQIYDYYGDTRRRNINNPWHILADNCGNYQNQNSLMKKADELYKIYPNGVGLNGEYGKTPYGLANNYVYGSCESDRCKNCQAFSFVLKQLEKRNKID